MTQIYRRLARARRLLWRARETPPRFLAEKAYRSTTVPAWNGLYRADSYRSTALTAYLLTTGSPGQECAYTAIERLAFGLRHGGPELDAPTLARADAAVANTVEILGFGHREIGKPIDWHMDHASGFRWPLTPGLSLDYVQAGVACDVKVPWEMNRLQMLVWLAQAAQQTGAACYAQHLEATFLAWQRANPTGMGVAWACAMEVAIRGINLVYALALAWDVLDEQVRQAMVQVLREHLTFLLRHPEVSDVNGNHYIADLMGSVGLAALLGARLHPRNAFGRSVERLLGQLGEQVNADGGHHEHALGYHRLVTEMLLHCAIALANAGLDVPTQLISRLGDMMRFAETLATDDDCMPLIGDADSGQVVRFDLSDPNSIGPLRAMYDVLIGHASTSSTGNAASWIAAKHLKASASRPPRDDLPADGAGALFHSSGYGVLRAGGSTVVTRAGLPGLAGRAPHDHADHTHFVAHLRGLPVIVDPGCSTYTARPAVRRYELAASSHNVLILGGQEPFKFVTGSVMEVVGPGSRGFLESLDAERRVLQMSHNGYAADDPHALVRRTITLPAAGVLHCEDFIGGVGRHAATVSLLLHPDWVPLEGHGRDGVFAYRRRGAVLHVAVPDGRLEVSTAEYSEHYGHQALTTALRLRWEVQAPSTTAFSLSVSWLTDSRERGPK